ncbi:uncharacterized protein KZ484_010515 [Pholidichthys leucotaenia]
MKENTGTLLKPGLCNPPLWSDMRLLAHGSGEDQTGSRKAADSRRGRVASNIETAICLTSPAPSILCHLRPGKRKWAETLLAAVHDMLDSDAEVRRNTGVY